MPKAGGLESSPQRIDGINAAITKVSAGRALLMTRLAVLADTIELAVMSVSTKTEMNHSAPSAGTRHLPRAKRLALT
ncbi:hypothetical protein [Agrobacterium pusense]|jgi:hypothetical protein|uniref:hypothetical protein n=1 Tax=Agrobacterium pusense TaxID=648995 RepID=UPI002452AB65|nr:hypothetical protein [Agrobacterium pusense]